MTFTLFFVLGAVLIFVLLGSTAVGALYALAHDPLVSLDQQEILTHGAFSLLVGLLVMGVFAVATFVLLGFYFSYKFVGPLYRLETWLESQLKEPNTSKIKLRPGDELNGIANLLQSLVTRVLDKKS